MKGAKKGREIIGISECVALHRVGKQLFHEFSFRGVVQGKEVKRIYVLSEENIELGELYIFFFEEIHIKESTLWGKVKKIKALENIPWHNIS